MSVLDQLEESFETFGFLDNSDTYSPEDWVVANTALAAHSAMIKGHNDTTTDTRAFTPAERPRQVSGGINVNKSLELAQTYKQILVNSQKTPIGLRPTADDVVDGGIKNGSKVVLQIVSESERVGTWDEQVKSNIRTRAIEGVTFDKFSVASFVESEDERYQIHETFGADIIQSFGRRPRFLTIAGVVVNGRMDVRFGSETRSMDWKNAFQRQYEKNFSLKACLNNRKKVRIYFQDTVYDGYLLQMTAATDAENQGISQVTVRVVVQKRYFPRDNDDQIPGTFRGNGFRLTGADVPQEFFPSDRIDFYFSRNYDNVLKGARFLLQEEIRTLAQRLSRIDGKIDQDTIIDRANLIARFETGAVELLLDIKLELSQRQNDDPQENNYLNRYSDGFKLTMLLQGGHLDGQIQYVTRLRNSNFSILTLKGTSIRITSANTIAAQILEKSIEAENLPQQQLLQNTITL